MRLLGVEEKRKGRWELTEAWFWLRSDSGKQGIAILAG